jgi:hypothetical protein
MSCYHTPDRSLPTPKPGPVCVRSSLKGAPNEARQTYRGLLSKLHSSAESVACAGKRPTCSLTSAHRLLDWNVAFTTIEEFDPID